MLGKIVVIVFFIVILFNLFSGLNYLLKKNRDENIDPDRLLNKLKWRIGLSMILFVLIIIGFLTGFIRLHTFG